MLVCSSDSRLTQETTQPTSTKCSGKETHGPSMKPLDFGSNLDHVTLGLTSG